MKVKIYELLGMIKDGKAPKKIEYNGKIYNYEDSDYFAIDYGYLFDRYNVSEILNHKVEIIEELQPTEEEINEYTNKFLEAWEPISKQFGKLFDEIIRIKNNLGLNLEENTKEPQEHKIPEKIEYTFNLGFIDINDKDLVIKEINQTVNNLYKKYNEIIDYLGDKE